jgi:hypothetical protein
MLLPLAFLLLLPAADDPPTTHEAVCLKVASAPVLDGKLDDPAWRAVAAHAIRRFPAFWDRKPSGEGTTAFLAWDDQALYFAATMTDAEVRSFGTKRNDTIWNGDVFELFFKPSADSPRYYEFQVNPASVLLDLPFPERGHSFEALAALPPAGFEAVATVDGTLNRPGDADRSWTVEGKIPWSYFAPSGGRPRAGEVWSFALCRYDYGPDGTEPELMSSAPLTVRSFHRHEDYGKLMFQAAD